MRTPTHLLPIFLAASVGVVSVLAACFDYTITTSMDPPTVYAACQ